MLNTDQLVTKALEVANASAFSDLRFLLPLESLIEGLNTEAALNEIGRQFHAARLIDLLANRLRLEQWIERYPEILEEEILSPIVVIGLPRTGTTMLHRSIAADDQLLAPL